MAAAHDSPAAAPDDGIAALPRRRADAERSFQAIVAAATRVLADNPRASMLEIATASGLGRATVYRHFASREELVRAIRAAALDETEAAIAASKPAERPPVEALEGIAEAICAVSDRYRVLAAENTVHPELREREAEVGAPGVAAIERGQEQGVIRTDLPASFLASAFFYTLHAALRRIAEGDLPKAVAPGYIITTFLDGARLRSGGGHD